MIKLKIFLTEYITFLHQLNKHMIKLKIFLTQYITFLHQLNKRIIKLNICFILNNNVNYISIYLTYCVRYAKAASVKRAENVYAECVIFLMICV